MPQSLWPLCTVCAVIWQAGSPHGPRHDHGMTTA